MLEGIVNVSGGGGYPPGGGAPPGGWGPPPGAPPGGGGYGPPPGAPPGGYGPPGGGPPPGSPPGGWGPPPGSPPGGPPPGYGPPGGPPPGAPPGYGPPGGGPPPGAPGGPPPGAPPGYGPPGGPPPGSPPGYGPPGGPPPGSPPGYGPPGGPPPGSPPGYGPPGGPPPGSPPGYGPPGGPPPGGPGGYGPPGGAPGGGYGGAPGGYGPPGGAPGGGFGGPPGGGWGGPPPGGGGPPGGYGGFGAAPPPTVGGAGGSWSPMEAVSFGWNALTKNFVGVSLPIAVAAVVAILPGQIITYSYVLMAALIAEFVEPSFIGVLSYIVQATSMLVGVFVNSFIMGGVISFALKVVRGQPYAFGDVFSGGKYFGRMLVGTIGLYVAVLIGMLLCIVPGYIVGLGLSMYAFLIVDQGLPGVDALKKSWAMTNGHKVNIFLFGLIGVGVVIAGLIACGIGVLLGSYPVMIIGAAYIYERLKGGGPAPTVGPAY